MHRQQLRLSLRVKISELGGAAESLGKSPAKMRLHTSRFEDLKRPLKLCYTKIWLLMSRLIGENRFATKSKRADRHLFSVKYDRIGSRPMSIVRFHAEVRKSIWVTAFTTKARILPSRNLS